MIPHPALIHNSQWFDRVGNCTTTLKVERELRLENGVQADPTIAVVILIRRPIIEGAEVCRWSKSRARNHLKASEGYSILSRLIAAPEIGLFRTAA